MKKKFDPAALPQESLSQHVLCEEYAAPGETTLLQVRQRVARALASDAQQEARFLQAQLDGFVPESSVNKAAGLNATATMLNCFVQPVADTLTGSVDGLPGIMDALAQTAHTMRRGGHVALDFSRLRPKGAKVTGLPSNAGGPLPYMRVFDCMCDTMGSDASSARAGLGGVLRIDHPDVVEFIGAKDAADSQQLLPLIPRNPALSKMNLSVAVTDEFMEAVINDRMFNLAHVAAPAFDAPLVNCAHRIQRYVYRVVQARELWARVVRATCERGGPAVLNLDAINRGNNLWYVERFETTSPGGEQPLPPFGACCGGSVNLARFVLDPFSSGARFDHGAFARVVAVGVEMLDRVLDVTTWPLPQHAAEAAAKRRIGLGYFGLADALAMLGLRYGSPGAAQLAAEVARTARDAAYRASVELAKQLGGFPLLDPDQYLKPGTFASTLPQDIQDGIRQFGIRNSHLLAIANTGGIALAFGDNATPGIDPIPALSVTRDVGVGNGQQHQVQAANYAVRVLSLLNGDQATSPTLVTAPELSPDDQLAIVVAVAPYIDGSFGNTITVAADYSVEQVEGVYMQVQRLGLKGVNLARPASGA